MTGNWEVPDFADVELAEPSAPGPHDEKRWHDALTAAAEDGAVGARQRAGVGHPRGHRREAAVHRGGPGRA